MDSESLLEERNVKFKELRSLIENLEKNFQDLKANAGQVAAAYVIFGCIMYIQVTLPSAALQVNCGISVGVLASVSIVFWLTFITTVKDCLRVRQQQDSTFMEQEKLYRNMFSIQNGGTQNDSGAATAGQQSLAKSFAFQRFKRYVYAGAVYSALFSFTLLVLYALFSVHRRG